MSKQQSCQKFIFKIHSSRLRKEKWKLNLPIDDARRNDEVIALADSQVLRWIDELNGIYDADEKAREIKAGIKELHKQPSSAQTRRAIKQLYADLDKLQFKPDYMCLIIDKDKDYYRACKGFTINDVSYKRLLGTNGGIKNSTIVFVSERLADEIKRRIENDRNPNKELVTAKLEAYKALACSSSVPVSLPKGIAVVDDAETEFFAKTMYLTDECDGEPTMELQEGIVKVDASDGFGLMLPSLAERWSEELKLDYVMSGCNTRFSFEKGMVYAFDFVDFAEKVAGTHYIKDAWGNTVDVRNVELIMTTSMVKLWDSYDSCEDYVNKSISNKYTFGVPKTCPGELENEHTLNYQFIQVFNLDDNDIDELIAPTTNEIEDVLNGDWRDTVLYLKGSGLNADNVQRLENDYVKAMMIDHRMLDDPFIQNSVYQLIRNRINEAKVGVIKVHGNYSIVSGDPYLLCQSMFGLEKTGLLEAGEIYNKYWVDEGAESLVMFRAPMSTAENVRLVHPRNDDKTKYWYRYMTTCTILNAWDLNASALNGMDFDGDLVMLTDNKVLLRRYEELPVLMCAQRKAAKRISAEEDFVKSNIESFGNEIGQTTNWITSMYEVQAGYPKDSIEYKTLAYRIRCGQLYQQNVIDKAKGIISKPMPREWHDRHSVNKMEQGETKDLYRNIVADRKPYFMRYIYPALMKEYNTYIKNTDKNALREFQMTVKEIMDINPDERTERQNEFLHYYQYRMPVGTNDCVMNIICKKIEDEFDGYAGKHNSNTKFDYRIMKSDAEYTPRQYANIKRLYDDYNKRLNNYVIFSKYERVDQGDSADTLKFMNDEFRKQCEAVCPDAKALCNIILDLCYTKSSTKRFAWNMCGKQIVDNLLDKNNHEISYPTATKDGDIYFCGNIYKLETVRITNQEVVE